MAPKFKLPGFGDIFPGRSTPTRSPRRSTTETPKSPAPQLGLPVLTSPIDLPGLTSESRPQTQSPAHVTSPTSARRSTRFDHVIDIPPTSPQSRDADEWVTEQVRDRAGNRTTRRRRVRGRPKGARHLLHAKAGRMKLFRCIGFGILLAAGVSVCRCSHVLIYVADD